MGVISVAVKHAAALGATVEQIQAMVEEMESCMTHPDIISAEIRRSKDRARKTPAPAPKRQSLNPENIPWNSAEHQKSLESEGFSQGNGGVIDSSTESSTSDSSNIVTSNKVIYITRARPRKSESDPDTVRAFERFWEVYPRREGKGAAVKAFRTAVRRGHVETIITMAKKYADSRRGEDKKFTAMAATWLNQDRWLDEPDVKQPVTYLGSPRKREWSEIKAERDKNAVVRGDDQGQEGRTGPKKPEMAGLPHVLPPLLRVDPAEEDQAEMLEEALSDAVFVRGDTGDEPQAQLLPDQQHDWGIDGRLLWLSGPVDLDYDSGSFP